MGGTSSPQGVSTGLQRVAELSRKAPEWVWTTLAHHITVELLREAHRRTRKDGAAGVDGQTAKGYEQRLEENLLGLLNRLKSGTYQAPPVKRVYIPKGDGKRTRPIGIPTFEDKVLQRAVAMVMEAVYEQDFLDCSFGFRPGRSAHGALARLQQELVRGPGGWVLEIDIEKFFDSLDHGQLRRFLDQRVRDGVLRRAIDKWLKAGVLEGEEYIRPEEGTPQGGVISPLLANIFLHEVLDKWFKQEVEPRLKGAACLIRYADDAVMVFTEEGDARRVLEVLPKRFGKYGLRLHPDKTRLIRFRRPGKGGPGEGGGTGPPGTFDFLGFTHYWGRTKEGKWMVKRKTGRDRLRRTLRQIYDWCRRNRHESVREQHRGLERKLLGHYQYYAIPGNRRALFCLRTEVARMWRKGLDRRSQRRRMFWDRFQLLLKRYPLPAPAPVWGRSS
jgi:group II intron reverse transcriptase/maturase